MPRNVTLEGIPGTCCQCGYSGTEETPCPERDDGHCDHWLDGASDGDNDEG